MNFVHPGLVAEQVIPYIVDTYLFEGLRGLMAIGVIAMVMLLYNIPILLYYLVLQ